MRNTDPEKMALSSADETKGIEPIFRAIYLVRLQISGDFLAEIGRQPEGDELPTIYVTSFAYILGGWKAMISTSAANGHYYEVTYNKAKRETYVDRYSKDYNEVFPDGPEKIVSETPAKSSVQIHFDPPPAGAASSVQALAIDALKRQEQNRYLNF